MRSSPPFLPMLLAVLFFFHGAGLFFALRRFPLPSGKAALPIAVIGLVAAGLYAMLLFLNYRRIRAGTTDARVATRRGVTLVLVGLLWAAASAAVVWNESTSMTLGLFAMAGMLFWYPAVLAGALFLLAVRRE